MCYTIIRKRETTNRIQEREDKDMTDRQTMINGLKTAGFEVTEIGNTIQWTNPNWTTICYFDENGRLVKTERS